MDPIELRLANIVGRRRPDGRRRSVAADRAPASASTRLRAHPLWAARDDLGPDEGVGVAAAVWLGAKQPAAATCRLEPDGTITVVTGAVDMSGNATTFAAIAAETFGVPFEAVTVVFADTQSAPPSPPSNASAITYAVGPAIVSAVAEARDRLLQRRGGGARDPARGPRDRGRDRAAAWLARVTGVRWPTSRGT